MAQDRYTQSWQGRERAQHFDQRADLVIPRRREMVAGMVRLLPYSVEEPIRVLDLGAGTGVVAEAVLARYAKALVAGVESSGEMIEIGRAKLAERGEQVQFLLRDLEQPDWNEGLSGPWHGVLSCLAIHLISDESKRRIFRQAHDMLQPDGRLIVADRLKAASPALDELYHEMWMEHIVRQTREVLGKDVPLQTVRERQHSLDEAAGLKCATLEQNLAWLRDAGFSSVECYWKDWQRAIFGGIAGIHP